MSKRVFSRRWGRVTRHVIRDVACEYAAVIALDDLDHATAGEQIAQRLPERIFISSENRTQHPAEAIRKGHAESIQGTARLRRLVCLR